MAEGASRLRPLCGSLCDCGPESRVWALPQPFARGASRPKFSGGLNRGSAPGPVPPQFSMPRASADLPPLLVTSAQFSGEVRGEGQEPFPAASAPHFRRPGTPGPTAHPSPPRAGADLPGFLACLGFLLIPHPPHHLISTAPHPSFTRLPTYQSLLPHLFGCSRPIPSQAPTCGLGSFGTALAHARRSGGRCSSSGPCPA